MQFIFTSNSFLLHFYGPLKQQFSKLTTKKEKCKNIKDQIFMHYLGLGWEEAHYPWSFEGHAFTAEELFVHLVSADIPLELHPSC